MVAEVARAPGQRRHACVCGGHPKAEAMKPAIRVAMELVVRAGSLEGIPHREAMRLCAGHGGLKRHLQQLRSLGVETWTANGVLYANVE